VNHGLQYSNNITFVSIKCRNNLKKLNSNICKYQKNLNNRNNTKFQLAEYFQFIFLRKEIIQHYLRAKANFQSSLLGVAGGASEYILLSSSGSSQVAVTLVIDVSSAN
jgi:hypothetical protein